MYTVYILRSQKKTDQFYVGYTSQNIKKRLAQHNAAEHAHTSKFIPWEIEATVNFRNEKTARSFEKYLKKGSGHAFFKKRLVS